MGLQTQHVYSHNGVYVYINDSPSETSTVNESTFSLHTRLWSVGSNCSGNICLPTVNVFSPLTDTLQEVVVLLVSDEKQQ